MNNSKEVVKKIKSIFEKIKSSCCIDSLVRIDVEECSCRGCIYSYTIKCMEEEVNVFR